MTHTTAALVPTGPSSTTSSATLVPSAVTAAVGTMLVLGVAAKNSAAAGIPSLSTTVTDSAGNTWINRGGLINQTAGVADDGITLSLWTCNVTTALSSGTITINFSPNTGAKAAVVFLATPDAGYDVIFDSVGAGGAGNGTSWSTGNVSVTSGYTIVGFTALENTTGPAADADTTNGSWSARAAGVASTGTVATSAVISSQFKTATATGNQSYDPTTGAARDYAWNWLILRSVVNQGVGTASGAGAAAGAGESSAVAAGAASGTGVATAIGAATASSDGVGSGTGTAAGTGAATSAAVSATSATGTAAATGAATADSLGASSAAGAAAGVGSSLVTGSGVGTGAGTGTAAGVGKATSRSIGAASGHGTVAGASAATSAARGAATAAGSAQGHGGAINPAVGAATGSGRALGVGYAATHHGEPTGDGRSVRILIQLDWPDDQVTRLWDGNGAFIDADGEVWRGAGFITGLDELERAVNGEAPGLTLTLSGVSTEISGRIWARYQAGNLIDCEMRVLLQGCDEFDQPQGAARTVFTGFFDNAVFDDQGGDDPVSAVSAQIVNKFSLRRTPNWAVLSDSDQKARSAVLNPLATPDRFAERVVLMENKTVTWPRAS